MASLIEVRFPGLRSSAFQITSPKSRDYNCIAWAAQDAERWWWPEAENDAAYWPLNAPWEETVAAFVAAFSTLGYMPCSGHVSERGFEKVALFALAELPTHAARQLPNGRWTSKLGMSEDIEHELNALEGEIYGNVVLIMRRRSSDIQVP